MFILLFAFCFFFFQFIIYGTGKLIIMHTLVWEQKYFSFLVRDQTKLTFMMAAHISFMHNFMLCVCVCVEWNDRSNLCLTVGDG